MAESKSEVPLSSEAQDAKEAMQQQLVRKMALKMLAEAEEQERARRVQEASKPLGDDAVRQRALDQIITVQEDLVRALNRMKVSGRGTAPSDTVWGVGGWYAGAAGRSINT